MLDIRSTVRGDKTLPELEFQRILVLTDFSSGAKAALDCAHSIARKFKSKIFLLHVIPSDAFQFVSPETALEAMTRAKEFSQQRLHRLMNDAEAEGIEHEGLVVEGPIWTGVSEVITSKKIDLLVAGTRGKSGGVKLVLGAVAEEVYRMADCPILTVPPDIAGPAGQPVELKRLLFATNFKPHNERAAAIAHSLECNPKGHLTVLHVVEDSGESSAPSQMLVEEFIIKRMRKGLPDHCAEQCAPTFEVRFGKPAEEILATAKQRSSDLILLGLRTAQRTAGYLPSPVAYSIVCRSACPVLTIHQ